ncbi:MAG: hypothetical protein M3N91_01850 [Pseudomonadota bacterium]|nr:hypothetical protein [Pseudomonadota bacterium]
MTLSSPTIVPILATPLGIASIPDSAQINAGLYELFAQRMAVDHRPRRNPLSFCSADDLMEWPELPVRRLADGITGAVCAVVGSLNEFTVAQIRAFKLESRAWFTVIRTNGSVPAANYPLTSWCAIYCVNAPPPNETRPESGVVRLYESRLGTTFQDASNSTMRIPYSQSHYAWRPVPGQMIIFPASLTHEIALLRAGGELTLVTARIRFTGAGQQGFGRW